MPSIDKLKSQTLVRDGLRFLIGGGLNTAISYFSYLFFLLFTHYQLAYALSWIVGLLIIVVFYPSRVFVGSKNSWQKTALLITQYVLVFFFGLQCLKALVVHSNLSEQVAALITMVLTTILNFLLMRLLFRRNFLR